jgi:hypothetical protein
MWLFEKFIILQSTLGSAKQPMTVVVILLSDYQEYVLKNAIVHLK